MEIYITDKAENHIKNKSQNNSIQIIVEKVGGG
ncbi:Uncharacterised protein [Tissierella praeacuta]|nr:hypothetical protein EV204_10324 [Tissierella praeacuta]SUO99789.1 Uncharacterised protein [Tissierella praeacuta]